MPLYECRQLHCYSSWASKQRNTSNISNIGIGQYANRNSIVGNSISVGSAVPKDLCMMYQISSLQQRPRHYSSSDSFSSKPTSETAAGGVTKGSALQSPANSKQALKKRSRRKKKSSNNYNAPIAQTHPKNTTTPIPPSRILTRKQILRLTPKQRSNLQTHRLAQYKSSKSYLDQARTNVRSNLQYLGTAADGNLKKNIQTIKRLFKGEEVWNDVDAVELSSKIQQREVQGLAKGIDWERAPSEIKANLQSNLSQTQNWLHKLTDGMIPSSKYVGANNAAGASEGVGGSVATRMQQFHQLKQNESTRLVMDRTWFAKNIALAILPGLLFHLYFASLQDEMKEYYAKLERQEREKIMGPMMTTDADGSTTASTSNTNVSGGGMGISTALITEGGSAWDKLKMTVNDVFLGGAQEKIDKQKELAQLISTSQEEEGEEQEGGSTLNQSTTAAPAANSSSSNHNVKISDSDSRDDAAVVVKANGLENNNDAGDATIQMLLERVLALEKQLRSDSDDQAANLSEEELRNRQEEEKQQRQKEHLLKYRLERVGQSPMQNRRDDVLAWKWREEARNSESKEQKKGDATKEIHREGDAKEEITKDDSTGNSSYSLADVANFAKLMVEPVSESMKKSAMQKMKEVMSVFPFGSSTEEEEKPKPTGSEQDAEEEEASPSPAAAESRRTTTVDDSTTSNNSDSLPNTEPRKNDTVVSSASESQSTETAADSNSIEVDTAAETCDVQQHDGNKKRSGGVILWVVYLWRRIRKPRHEHDGASGNNDGDDIDDQAIDKKEE